MDGKRTIVAVAAASVALLGVVLFAAAALAQSGGPYTLEWQTIDGGGAAISGGPYTLIGTVGQAEAGAPMTGGGYTVSGGFWNEGMSPPALFLPVVFSD